MGWWDAGIFGGDSPLDAIGGLQTDALGVAYDYEDDFRNLYPIDSWDAEYREMWTRLLDEKEEDVMAWIEREKDAGYQSIKAQVTGAVYMATGGPMPDRVRELVVELSAKDEWAMEEPEGERHKVVTEFIATVQGYKPGEPVIVGSKGLMETMVEGLVEPVLIDKLRRQFGVTVKAGGHEFTIGEIIDVMCDDDFTDVFTRLAEDFVTCCKLPVKESV